jgi:hypothetical protein
MFTVQQIKDTMRKVTALSPLNKRGEFTVDQIRAALVHTTGQQVQGEEVAQFVRSHFPVGSVKGYYWILNGSL